MIAHATNESVKSKRGIYMVYIVVMLGFGLFFLTMAIGVMMGRKPIAGSCGGLAQVGLNGECKVCGKTPGSCDPESLEMKVKVNSVLVIDATKTNKIGEIAQSSKGSEGDSLANRLNKARFRDPLDF
jgi:hypothetical protein